MKLHSLRFAPWRKASGFGLILFALVACASSSHYREIHPAADALRDASRYAWGLPPVTEQKTWRAKAFDEAFRREFDQRLSDLDVQHDPDNPQFLVEYRTLISPRPDLSVDETEYPVWNMDAQGNIEYNGWQHPTAIGELVTEGEVILLFRDPTSKKILWAGSASKIMEYGISAVDASEVAKAAADILARKMPL